MSLDLEVLVQQEGLLPERARKDLEEHLDEYKRLIARMAKRYERNRVEYDDLIQEAAIGLILAERDFNPERSSDFHTYAITRMKGKMYEYCISNDNLIHVPTHVAKAASYTNQMRRLLEKESYFFENNIHPDEVILQEQHPAEEGFTVKVKADLAELKRKLGRIALHSKTSYSKLANLALKSTSSISDLSELESPSAKTTGPWVTAKQKHVHSIIFSNSPASSFNLLPADANVFCFEVWKTIRKLLNIKQLLVVTLRSQDWTYREIAEKLYELGYKNKRGKVISRQAVKGIYDSSIRIIRSSDRYKVLEQEEDS